MQVLPTASEAATPAGAPFEAKSLRLQSRGRISFDAGIVSITLQVIGT
jgi:hypothetical protein